MLPVHVTHGHIVGEFSLVGGLNISISDPKVSASIAHTSGSKGFPQYIWATSPSVRVELGPSGRFRRWAMACSFVVGDSQCDPEALSSRCMSSPSEGMGPRLQSTQKASRMLDHTREQRPDERGLVGHRASTSAITRLHC